ncbi:MAG: bifunctional phosphoribosylaminoimidazolecarboxamide formyltransferase/IMP cyclohydrolase [Acidobacteria bacterium]|nr:bifunctional phosphoribosylaminoimidazolecarboxamide formyltransferase/IMP cyclohydrolase [Acidobacteriota bacterium]MBI3663081.1 bifunctional phosphoribosylaminoimidazolecarboxamide formyltransferase/IMP cyclohydrolase [Acidobacteriota bacterium]
MVIERALISVFDKTGILKFSRQLVDLGIEVVSTGGTAKMLRDAGLRVRDVAELTGWPEMLGGRVKTLHPRVHGGILYRRANADDQAQVLEHGIPRIDLVVVNLYPFEATAARPDLTPAELIENIDIGGPTMVRSAAKNLESVAVVTDPADYGAVAAELRPGRSLCLATRLQLARKAFAVTSRYDGRITTELERLSAEGNSINLVSRSLLPERLHIALQCKQTLRYGENPHQQAALYVPAGKPAVGLAGAVQLQGKELSYNNFVDLDAAWRLVEEFDRPAAVIIKHNNPCGSAEQDALLEAYRKAFAGDPVSAFGGVLAFNRPLDAVTAEEVSKLFVECIVAPDYEPAALEKLAAKKNLRLMRMAGADDASALELKRISGGVLVQDPDRHRLAESNLKVVTKRTPTPAELQLLLFAWKVANHVKSNAIVFARDGQSLGVGAGQMSRVDSVKIAVMKAATAGLALVGSVVGSDAFFPFPDGVEEAARAGAIAVIQPGGSVRDNDVIATADKLGLAMVFTGVRHFRH